MHTIAMTMRIPDSVSRPVALRLVSAAALAFCVRCASQQMADSPLARLPAGRTAYRLHTPRDFAEILGRSSVRYATKLDEKTRGLNLPAPDARFPAVSPYACVVNEAGGGRSLAIDPPGAPVLHLYRKAEKKLRDRDYRGLLDIYRRALALDSAYFLSWINLGNAHVLLKDRGRAEQCILNGLKLNSACYRGYLVLADVYLDNGDTAKALEYIVRAYALNRFDPEVERAAGRIAACCGMRLRDDRLSFPFEIRKTGAGSCDIAYKNDDARAWSAMAGCLACWRMEPHFREEFAESGRSIPAKLAMYRECLINQTMVIAEKKSKGARILPRAELLLKSIADTCLGAILYWEIISAEVPHVVLLLPGAEQERIVKYIRTYVFEKRR